MASTAMSFVFCVFFFLFFFQIFVGPFSAIRGIEIFSMFFRRLCDGLPCQELHKAFPNGETSPKVTLLVTRYCYGTTVGHINVIQSPFLLHTLWFY